MKTTIDAAGRLVVPKPVRREANLKPGDLLEVQCRDGRIEIEPAALPLKLVRRRGLLVAEPLSKREPLTSDVVEQTRREIRRDRNRRVEK